MGLDATKPFFGVTDKSRFKPVSSATGTSQKIEISLVSSLDMILSKRRLTKALISLCGCTGWSAPLLFANHRMHVFSCRGPIMISCFRYESNKCNNTEARMLYYTYIISHKNYFEFALFYLFCYLGRGF